MIIGGKLLRVARWPLVPKFAGSKPDRSRRIFKGEKIFSTPSFGGEVKPSVPCRRFATCKISLNFGKITGQHSCPQFHLPPLGSLASLRHLVAKVGTSKRGGKQWQTTPKNLPRMQCTRAIPVAWLNSGLCPNRPKGWIPIIIIISTSSFPAKRLYAFLFSPWVSHAHPNSSSLSLIWLKKSHFYLYSETV